MKQLVFALSLGMLLGCGVEAGELAGSVNRVKVKRDVKGPTPVAKKPGGESGRTLEVKGTLNNRAGGDPGGGDCPDGHVPCGVGPCCDSATERCGDGQCHPRTEGGGDGGDGGTKPAEVEGAT